jgi:formylglycine-generating enzyme required for sulfatase activity
VRHPAFRNDVTREDLVRWFRAGRSRTEQIFRIPTDDAYYDRPIALRNPIVFYEGHLPAFTVNTLLKLALHERGIDERYETLFARGIDPESEDAAKPPTDVWPPRADIRAYGARADDLIEHALRECPIDDGLAPQRVNGEAALAILEHEQMHQETLLYMFHELPYEKKRSDVMLSRADGEASVWRHSPPAQILRRASPPQDDTVRVPAGEAVLGERAGDFGWDNEFPAHRVAVDEFEIDRHNVTNGDYLEFVNATGANPPHFWARENGSWMRRAMFALEPLPLDAAVYVTHEEASAYAAWRGKRLMTEAEYHRAAFGDDGRMYPWGDEPPDATRGNFGFANTDPVAVGSYPAGASAFGVHDLVGNGWEWTSTVFAGYDGFRPMPSYPVYSSDFFDGKHYVLKGASPATAPELIRRSFRNWFRPNYPYVYATFRCAA